jgi:23S rRNA G2445 N2-methylase RlmL
VARHVELAVADARRFEPLGPSGMIVFNPPYGERLAVRRERLEGLYRALGRSLRPPGHVAVAISGNAAFVRCFGARPAAHFHTFNGPLRCEVSRWDPAPQGD